MDYKYTGIILDKKDVGETDRIYSIYTLENGKIRVLAKSVRKANAKLAGFLENFTLAEIFISKGQGMGKITGAIVSDNFYNIRKNIDLLQKVFESVKIFSKLIREENRDDNIFMLLKEYLETIDMLKYSDEKSEIITIGFFFKLLDELGYKIEINSCVECGKLLEEKDHFFDPERGGIVCHKCPVNAGKKLKISSNAIKMLRIMFKNRIKNLVKLKVEKKDSDNLRIIGREFMAWIG